MSWLYDLVFGTSVASSIILVAFTITVGIILGKVKIFGISLGITWILFVGIVLGHFGLEIDPLISSFVKDFGLILFVYSIGLQLGPGFFSSLKQGGLRLNLLAVAAVVLSVGVTYIIHLATNEDLSTMVGVMSGAVTNTPALGAAEQTFADSGLESENNIASAYAVAYPLGVLGIILVPYLIKVICKIKPENETSKQEQEQANNQMAKFNVLIENQGVVGKHLSEITRNFKTMVVVSRVKHADGSVEVANDNTVLQQGDTIRLVTNKDNEEAVCILLGKKVQMGEQDWETPNHTLVTRRAVVTKSELNGKKIGSLNIRTMYKVTITRINRNGIDLIAEKDLILQTGDRVTLVGEESNVEKVTSMLGNSMKRLNSPNLIPIFLGIVLGIVLGSVPIAFPFLPQSVKLGLAGGPLIVAILMGRFGPYYKIVTFTTTSANMMVREIGISLFLAAVGLSAGENFFSSIASGGYVWIVYGLLITIVPLLLVGLFARMKMKMDYFTLCGLLAGSTTDPPALAFANEQSPNDAPSVAYASVYPLTMFLRVLSAQVLMIIALS
ncbi:MAG: putative transporter [Candidatus Onthomorpha sp.]|nr:putative transporter [Candidatus Onthomorpha sp.]